MTHHLVIRTPEGVTFSQELASPAARGLACGLDALVVGAAASLITVVVSLLTLLLGQAAEALGVILWFVLSIGYGIFFEYARHGQTIGKRVMKLQVVDARGLRLRFGQILVRNLLRVVDMFPMFYLVGGITSLLSPRLQRLGDLAAHTVVIRLPRPAAPNLDQLLAGKYNSFRAHPHLAARLRQRMTPAEAALALHALLRRELLEPAARLQLFGSLADRFRQIARFPDDACQGLTDEQYVRNVVDVIYRKDRR